MRTERQQTSRHRNHPAADPDYNNVRSPETENADSQMTTAATVSGRWLVKAVLVTVMAAGFALYCTVCLLFYQGQWQFVFSPPGLVAQRQTKSPDMFAGSWARRSGPTAAAHTAMADATAIAASSGLPITDHRFAYTQEGVATLDGWWIPAAVNRDNAQRSTSEAARISQTVVLFCHNGHTNLAGNIEALQAFHSLGVSVFAFDYRGFGSSQSGHPSQQKAYADGAAALRYLTGMRHIDPQRIVIYGAELGAAVAAQTAEQSPKIAGLILENPQPSLAKQVKRQEHIHVLPMWLIFPDRFDISRIMPTLKMPKLVIATPVLPEYTAGAAAVYKEAIAPKQMVHMDASGMTLLYTQPGWQQAVRRFLFSVHAPAFPAQ